MLRRLYNWTISSAQSPYALWVLALVSFIESSFFPIPPDVLMIPMIIARPSRAFLIAAVATVASVAGGLFGYYIGAVLMETIGQPIVELRDGPDLLLRGLVIVEDPVKSESPVLDGKVAGPPVPIPRLPHGAHVDDRLLSVEADSLLADRNNGS